MTRITRQTDPFAGKDYSDMGRSISSFQLVHRNASLDSKWRPRYKSSFASQSPALVGNESEPNTRFKPNNSSPSLPAVISTPSDNFRDVELSKEPEDAQRKRNRRRKKKKKLRLSQSNALKSQSTTSAVILEKTTIETQNTAPSDSKLSQQGKEERKSVAGGERKMDNWQQALAKAAKAAEEGPACYHLLLKQLETELMREY